MIWRLQSAETPSNGGGLHPIPVRLPSRYRKLFEIDLK
jgi:hypothetical protein